MFSKNILLLLCVVCCKCSTTGHGKMPAGIANFATSVRITDEGSSSSVNTILNDITDEQLKTAFIKYDLKMSSISPEQLQKLIFTQFYGFITIRHAKLYTKLLFTKNNNKIDLNLLIKMKPIIFFLTKQDNVVDIKHINVTFTSVSFVEDIKTTPDANILFLNDNEISEIIHLNGQKRNSLIKWTNSLEIGNMVGNSVLMVSIYMGFCDIEKNRDGAIVVNTLVNAWIRGKAKKPANEDLKTIIMDIIMAGDLNHDGLIDFYEYMVMMCKDYRRILFDE
ncbi:uncharacterized protein LOC126839030 [Adelges cooleyi]|uniref:uncharacterized protein LOC126839030 n=1 Tax=Adelges cooleyi TaxID=133065 RepID=UPI002180138F|nr:uncharacterized protein LOC126839030 [Adelges cooleyi]